MSPSVSTFYVFGDVICAYVDKRVCCVYNSVQKPNLWGTVVHCTCCLGKWRGGGEPLNGCETIDGRKKVFGVLGYLHINM